MDSRTNRDGTVVERIPNQTHVAWGIVIKMGWSALRRRLLRSIMTMISVVLAIAFLNYMLIGNAITQALIKLNHNDLNRMLQDAGVNVFEPGRDTPYLMMLLGLTLLITLVGIVNAMLMAVAERVKEIGTLKCIGADNSYIVRTFLVESSLQGMVGTAIGAALGLFVALAVQVGTYRGAVFESFPAWAVLGASLASLLIGAVLSVVASIVPAYIAARKQPVEALRSEE